MFAGNTEIVVGVDTMVQMVEEYLSARIKDFADEQCITEVSWDATRGFIIHIVERVGEDE